MEKCCVSTHSLGSLLHPMNCGRKPCLLKHVRNFVSGASLVFRVVEIFKLRWLLALNQRKELVVLSMTYTLNSLKHFELKIYLSVQT